jgi:uncharacterized protein (DUF4415 family)
MNKQVSKTASKSAPKTPLINPDGEVRELTADDLKGFKPARDVLPLALQKSLGVRGAQKAPTKVSTTIRLSPDVLEAFKAKGNGWQTQIDIALKEWLRTHSPA